MAEPVEFNPRRLHPREWEENAACFGPKVEEETRPMLMRLGIGHLSHTELFYPPRKKEIYHVYADAAKDYCLGKNRRTPCPVRRQCLAWAVLTNEEHGIFGGMSHRERNALVRKADKAGIGPVEYISRMEN